MFDNGGIVCGVPDPDTGRMNEPSARRIRQLFEHALTIATFSWARLRRDPPTLHYWRNRHNAAVLDRDDAIYAAVRGLLAIGHKPEDIPRYLGWTVDEYRHWMETAEPPALRTGII